MHSIALGTTCDSAAYHFSQLVCRLYRCTLCASPCSIQEVLAAGFGHIVSLHIRVVASFLCLAAIGTCCSCSALLHTLLQWSHRSYVFAFVPHSTAVEPRGLDSILPCFGYFALAYLCSLAFCLVAASHLVFRIVYTFRTLHCCKYALPMHSNISKHTVVSKTEHVLRDNTLWCSEVFVLFIVGS